MRDVATSVKLQADGKIVVAGYTGTQFNYDFALARYYPNGTIDSSFGTNGKVIINIATFEDVANALSVQPDEKILVAGTAWSYVYDSSSVVLLRYDATASCMASFVVYPDTSNQGVYYGYNQSTGNNLNYLWQFGDGDSSTLQYPSHIYSTPGQYYVCLTVTENTGCINTYCDSSFYVFKTEGGLMSQLTIIAAPTAISQSAISNPQFAIFPNPTSDKLFIQTNGIELEQINIYNTTGSLVMAAASLINHQLSIINLPSGVYIAEIKTKEGSVRKRWIKM
ncbi:MAG: PKD domain-containing protein [Bacteroidetes bacterium]|nr:PKD domain-containing protein [Bacteroidota bacterium]